MENNYKPIVGITMGDPAGNGPEITVKALGNPELYERCRPIVIGDAKMLEQAKGFVHREELVIKAYLREFVQLQFHQFSL